MASPVVGPVTAVPNTGVSRNNPTTVSALVTGGPIEMVAGVFIDYDTGILFGMEFFMPQNNASYNSTWYADAFLLTNGSGTSTPTVLSANSPLGNVLLVNGFVRWNSSVDGVYVTSIYSLDGAFLGFYNTSDNTSTGNWTSRIQNGTVFIPTYWNTSIANGTIGGPWVLLYSTPLAVNQTSLRLKKVSVPDKLYAVGIIASENSTSASFNYTTVTVDNTAPQISFVYPTPAFNSYIQNNITINVSYIESNPDKLILNWNGTNETYSYSGSYTAITKSLTDGVYSYYAWINDTAKNSKQTETRIVIVNNSLSVDNTPPSLTFVSPTPANSAIIDKNWVYVNVTLSEPGGTVISLDWNGTNISMNGFGTNFYLNKTGLGNAVYYYRVYANDFSGNMNVSETRTVTINTSINASGNATAPAPTESIRRPALSWFDYHTRGLLDEYYVDTAAQNFHTKQNSAEDRAVVLTMNRFFKPNDILEYDFIFASPPVGDRGGMTVISINRIMQSEVYIWGAPPRAHVGSGEEANIIDGFETVGRYHVKIIFLNNKVNLSLTIPNGTTISAIGTKGPFKTGTGYDPITNLTPPYAFTFWTRTCHVCTAHIDYDNFTINGKVYDDFSGSSLDTSKWILAKPDGTADTFIPPPVGNSILKIKTKQQMAGDTINVNLDFYNRNPTVGNPSVPSLNKYIQIDASGDLINNLAWSLLQIYYNTSDIPSNSSENNLRVYYYNETNKSWGAYDGANVGGVNTEEKYVWANTTHFSTFGVFVMSNNLSACQGLTTANGNYVLTQNVNSAGTCFNILANNITIDGNGYTVNYSQSVAGYAINNSGGYDNLTIKNLNIVQGNPNVQYAFAVYGYGMENSTVTNNTIATSGNWSFGIGLGASSRNNLSGNTITTSGYLGVGIGLIPYNMSVGIGLIPYSGNISSSGNIISKNHITTSGDWGFGIGVDSTNNTLSDNQITTSGSRSLGIYLSNSSRNALFNNTVTTSGSDGYGIVLESSSNSNIISNNTISNSNTGITVMSSNDNIVAFNRVHNATEQGVAIIFALNSTVKRNNVSFNLGEGILLVNSSFTTISDNIANSNGQCGGICLLGSSNNVIENNTANNNTGGIRFYSSSNNTLTRNYVANSTYDGIGIDGLSNYNSVSFNVLSYNTNHGIYLNNASSYNQIFNNTVNFTVKYHGIGLYRASNYNVISHNTLYNSNDSGVYLDTVANSTISYNLVYNNLQGIQFRNSNSNNATSNTVYNNSYVGFLLNSANSSSVRSNNVTTSSNTSYGILVYGISNLNTISNNIIVTSGSEGDGITLYSPSNSSTLSNNTITTSGKYSRGIHLDASNSNNLSSNVITTSNLHSYGIWLYGGSNSNSLSNNAVITSGSSGDGILLSSSSSNTFSNNAITTSGYGDGIHLYSSSTNTITGGSIISISYDYYLQGTDATNNFTSTNWTAQRTIYFDDNTSWFNYNNQTNGNIWLKTSVSAAAQVNRTLAAWSQSEMRWNDTSSPPSSPSPIPSSPTGITAQYNITGLFANTQAAWSQSEMRWNDTSSSPPISPSPIPSSPTGITAQYNITGLFANTQYNVYNASGGVQTNSYNLTTDANGNLPSFTIALNGNTEVRARYYASCSDGIQNQGETGVDCGGPCSACYSPPISSSPPSSGSSFAPPPTATAKETRLIATLEPGVVAVVNISKPELSVSELKIEVKDAVTNVSVSVEKLDSKPSSITALPTAEGKVYKYISFSSTVPSASLSRVKMKFKVENYWISSNNFSTSTVYLTRYSSGWSKLHTTFLSSDSTYAYFEAESPGFSTFAITGEKAVLIASSVPAGEKPAPVSAPPEAMEKTAPEESMPAAVVSAPTGLALAVSLISQSDIDSVLKSLDSVAPQTEQAKALLEQARLKVAESQAALNNNEQARAKQLLGEAKAIVDEVAGIESAAVEKGKTGIFIILLIFVLLVAGVYTHYARSSRRKILGSEHQMEAHKKA